MDPQPDFGFEHLFALLADDVAKAVGGRADRSPPLKPGRPQAAAPMTMGFRPRDAIEAMFAGHAVMFHELLVDTLRLALIGEVDTMRGASRTSIIAIDKAFRLSLDNLEYYRLRPWDGLRDGVGAPPGSSADPLPAEGSPAAPAQSPARPVVVETELSARTSAAAIAACRANREAKAALEAGDPVRFARALGVPEPNEAFLAAARAPGSPFDRRRPANGNADATQAEPRNSVDWNSVAR